MIEKMPTHRFDPNFTDNVINAMGPKVTPRFRQLMASLTRHLHDYARENELTVDEWMAAVQMMNRAGQMSNEKRNEGQLLSDVFGLESYVFLFPHLSIHPSIAREKQRRTKANQNSLVDEITYTLAEEAEDAPTATAILGPFFRHDTPYRQNGETIVMNPPADGEMTLMHGRVVDFATKEPLVGATVEVWQASTNGMYEQQDPEQCEHNLRGKFRTDDEGRYSFYCLRPTPYPVPDDGISPLSLSLFLFLYFFFLSFSPFSIAIVVSIPIVENK